MTNSAQWGRVGENLPYQGGTPRLRKHLPCAKIFCLSLTNDIFIICHTKVIKINRNTYHNMHFDKKLPKKYSVHISGYIPYRPCKYIGQKCRIPPYRKYIFCFFWKNWKFQIIIRNLKILDYKEKSENFYNPFTLSCKKKPQQHIHSAHNNTLQKIFQENSWKLEQQNLTLLTKILWSLFMCSSKDKIKEH